MQHLKLIQSIIAEILGVDEQEAFPEAEFHLDLNASMEELLAIKSSLEDQLDIILPDFEPDYPATVQDLLELVNDATL